MTGAAPDLSLGMPCCFNTSTIRPVPLLDKIRIVGEAGYGAIELWHDELDACLAGGAAMADVRNALSDQGLIVPTTIYLADWFDAPPEEYPVVLEECKRRMAQAAELGAPYVIASPPAGEADHDLGSARYRELLEQNFDDVARADPPFAQADGPAELDGNTVNQIELNTAHQIGTEKKPKTP